MQCKTRSQKPKLELELEININRRKFSRVSRVVDEVNVSIKSCLNVKPIINPLLEKLEVHTQIEEEDLLSNLSGEIFEGTNRVREELIVRTSEVRREGPLVTMNLRGGGKIPPPILPILHIPHFPSIDPLVRLRGLPIVVPHGLAAVDVPSHLPKF